MTNTQRLIEAFKHCQREGVACRFMVGRFTGNGTSVVAALRRRGYTVGRTGADRQSYEITSGPAAVAAPSAANKTI